jgi:type IV pilus assembly protein PilB
VEALVKLGFSDKEIPKLKLYRPIGCGSCIKGYKGRTAIYEALYVTRGIRKIILESDRSIDEELLRQTAERQGMRTLRHAGLELIRSGVTSAEEVASVTVDED